MTMTLTLGHIELDVPFFQAALSGYSDHAMRRLARQFGCPLTFTGVMLAKSMANPRVLRKACFHPKPNEHPVGAQILSRTPATMAAAARALIDVGYDLIDLNFACPAPKVLRRRRGGALLDEPDLVTDIIKAVQDAVDCPILLKLRIGVDHKPQSRENFWKIVQAAVDRKVTAIVIHGRTVTERYRGPANWDILAKVKQTYPHALIIGSGDVFDAQETIDRWRTSGLDGFVIARGAVGNPWIFPEFRAVLDGKSLPPAPSPEEQKRTMLKQLEWILDGYPEKRAVGYFRKFLVGYVRRHPQRKKALIEFMTIKTACNMRRAIERWYPDDT